MSNFPLVRHRATDVWIPETDIDGVDAKENVMANANNVEFSNGFFENMLNVRSVDLPSNVLQEIQNYDYEILDVKTFKHSTQGWQTLYILWNDANGIKFYLSNTALDAYLLTSGTTDVVIIDEKPERISYNLVNDQLKINLNVTGTYYNIKPTEHTILNLTLCYLPEVRYSQGSLLHYTRNAGWYLTPRWLGWNFENVIYGVVKYSDRVYTFETGTTGVGGEPGGYIESCSLTRLQGYVGAGYYPNSGQWFVATAGGANATFEVGGIDGATKLRFHARYDIKGCYVRVVDTNDQTLLADKTFNNEAGALGGYVECVMDLPFHSDSMTIIISATNNGMLMLDDISIEYGSEGTYTVVAKYFDGQRAVIQNKAVITADAKLRVYKDAIDWRVVGYEIYNTVDGVDILVDEFGFTGWTIETYYIEHSIGYEETENTLNFNYNLPATARVDNQRYIYSEIVHKGRIYFVNEDYKVYQSHISTNLAIQADAFPYDEETGFGYFIVDHSKVNLALANSPTNDMVIITNQGFYLYFIQPSGSGSFKQLKMGSGSLSISSLKTLTSALNGEPATDGLFWIDANGIYFYGGGLTPPENLITEGHLRYWQAFTVQQKENAVGFYNPTKKEYWLCINNEFLIYELPFKKFRPANGLAGLTTFAGYRDLVPYYMSSGNTLIACDGTTRIAGQIESHYNTVEGNPEIYHKIMQEIYIEFGTSDGGAIVGVEIYVDDRLAQTYYFNTNSRYDKYLAPIALRFNRAKMKVLLPANKYVRVKEFGYSFSLDVAEPLAIVPVSIAESGYGFDYGNSYGN